MSSWSWLKESKYRFPSFTSTLVGEKKEKQVSMIAMAPVCKFNFIRHSKCHHERKSHNRKDQLEQSAQQQNQRVACVLPHYQCSDCLRCLTKVMTNLLVHIFAAVLRFGHLAVCHGFGDGVEKLCAKSEVCFPCKGLGWALRFLTWIFFGVFCAWFCFLQKQNLAHTVDSRFGAEFLTRSKHCVLT